MDKIEKYLTKNLIKGLAEAPRKEQQKYRCSLCQDRGLIIEGDEAYPCHCVKQHTAMKKFSSAKMTPALFANTFEKFDLKYYSSQLRIDKNGPSYRAMAEKALAGAKQFVADYLENRTGQGLLFEGDVGSGKTFLAGAITNALLEAEVQVLFLVVPDFLDDLRATYFNQGEFSETDLMNAAKNAEVLILDDLGAHNFTEWTQNKIFSLINYRMNYGLPCIITTNLNSEDMSEVVGARTVSRIIDICRIYRLHVGEDIRVAMRKG